MVHHPALPALLALTLFGGRNAERDRGDLALELDSFTSSSLLRHRNFYPRSSFLVITSEEGECPHRGQEYKQYCGTPKADLGADGPKPIVFSHGVEEEEGICSQFNQDRLLDQIFKSIGTANTQFVEFGARRPEVLNSAHFRLNCGWGGLLMDGAPGNTPNGRCPDCAGQELINASDQDPVRLRQAFFTPKSINKHFEENHVPNVIDILTVDIDQQDYWVVEALDFTKYQPRVVAIEFSSYFNSSELMVSKQDSKGVWNGRDVTGASLAALDALMTSRGYKLVATSACEHGIWVQRKEMAHGDEGMPLPSTCQKSWQWEKRLNSDYELPEGFVKVEPPHP